MMYGELVFDANKDILNKTVALAAILQRNLNGRLDDLIFRAVASQADFDAGIPHAQNVISLVQVDASEINIYKGDTRIFLGGGGEIPTNHALLLQY